MKQAKKTNLNRDLAAKFKRGAVVVAFAALFSPAVAWPAHARPVVEVAFVLDTTGSMSGLIEGAKRKIWSIATSILECSPDAEIRMGLVAYRDIGDDYVTKTFPLTGDVQDLYGNLIELKARGGGDWPESVNEALDIAVNKLEWSTGKADVTRIMFLVGDAPPHMDYKQDTKYPQVLDAARTRGITVNAVQAGAARDTEKVWREIAQMGRGDYIPIPQDGGKVLVIETPYDVEIIEIQRMINRTIVPYGTRLEQDRTDRKVKQAASLAAAAPSAASEMSTFMAKRARTVTVSEAVTGDGDLVADVAAGRMKLDKVKEDELPDAVRKLPPPQRQAYLDTQMSERKDLDRKLNDLVKKRDAYVADARKKLPVKDGDSFDRAVEKTIRAQVKR